MNSETTARKRLHRFPQANGGIGGSSLAAVSEAAPLTVESEGSRAGGCLPGSLPLVGRATRHALSVFVAG
jgi:hypothetical protein